MMNNRKSEPASSRRDIIEGSIITVLVLGLLAAIAIMIYQRSTATGSFRDVYKGKIVDKRTSVFETNEGSRFKNELIVEEAGGHQFSVGVTREIYDRAKPGMLIQRTAAKGVELLANPESNRSGE
jgi:hypothetical protein